MSDFSQYGGIDPEWDPLIASLPPVALPANITPLELRRITNEEREAVSRKVTQAVGESLSLSPSDCTIDSADYQMMCLCRPSRRPAVMAARSRYACTSANPQGLTPSYLFTFGITEAVSCLALSGPKMHIVSR